MSKQGDIRSFFGVKSGSQSKTGGSSKGTPIKSETSSKPKTNPQGGGVQSSDYDFQYGWTCPSCTYDNVRGSMKCEICGCKRPKDDGKAVKKKHRDDSEDEPPKQQSTKKRLRKVVDVDSEAQDILAANLESGKRSTRARKPSKSPTKTYDEQAKELKGMKTEKFTFKDDTDQTKTVNQWKFKAQKKEDKKPMRKEEKKVEVDEDDFFATIGQPKKTTPGKMDIEKQGSARKPPGTSTAIVDEDDGNSSGTEVIEDDYVKPPSPSVKKKIITSSKQSKKPKDDDNYFINDEDDEDYAPKKTLAQVTDKYKKGSGAKFFGDSDEEEEVMPKTKSKGRGASSGAKGKGSKKSGAMDEEDNIDDIINQLGKKSTKKKSGNEAVQGPLTGQTIVMTGLLDQISREDLADLLKNYGAKVTGSISKKTTILIAGSVLEDGRKVEQSRKYIDAQSKGTQIMSENEFDDYLFKKTGNRLIDGLGAALSNLQIPTPATATPTKTQPKSTTNTQKSTTPGAGTANNNGASMSNEPDTSRQLWTHKYAPRNIGEIIGNQNFIREIMVWLKDWEKVIIHGEKKDVKFNPQRSKDNWQTSNVNARACLVSGPPGIGKTSSIRIIAKTMGYDVIEQNASDVRNKNAVTGLLGHLTDNKLVTYNKQKQGGSGKEKFLILMDEVDGMSSGDRGGNQALIQAIKTSKTPIICICNDRMHTKIRSLSNSCYDIRYQKPNKIQIAKRLIDILAQEGVKADNNSLEYICEMFGNDIRQILNYLQMQSKKTKVISYMDTKNEMGRVKKDETGMLNNFDATKKLMSSGHDKKSTIRDKLDLFFIDYDLIPLMVQENYLGSNPVNKANEQDLARIAAAADLISTGDVLNASIRKGNWSLMPNLGFTAAIFPCEIANPFIHFPKFPEWLGKNSSSRKKQRELRELKSYLSVSTTGTRQAVLLDYVKPMIDMLNHNMKNGDKLSVENVVEIMVHYNITPDVIKDHLTDLNPRKTDALSDVPSNAKGMLTRLYNQRHKDSIKNKKAKKTIGAGGGASEEGKRYNPEAEEEVIEEVVEDDENENETPEDTQDVEEIQAKGKSRQSAGGAKGRGKKKN